MNGRTTYFEEFSASGALYVLVFITDDEDVDFTRLVFLALDRVNSLNFMLPPVSPGAYIVFVYDIEHNGTLHNGVSYPAIRSNLIFTGNGPGINECTLAYIIITILDSPRSLTEGCRIKASPLRINVECLSQAVGFQVIAQSGVLERVHRLYVNQTLPGHTSASVEVEDGGVYLVSIIPIIEGRGITGSRVEYRETVLVPGMGSNIITRLLFNILHFTPYYSTSKQWHNRYSKISS